MRGEETYDVNRLLLDFKPLIHKTLQRLNITQRHMDYDDYYQELQLHLLSIRAGFFENEEQVDVEGERYKFTAYAGKGLFWHGLNLLKRNRKHQCDPLEDGDLEQLQEDDAETDGLVLQDFFAQAEKLLSGDDYELLLCLADEGLTMDDIAERLCVTRSTIYQRRARIQERLLGIKNCLTNDTDKSV